MRKRRTWKRKEEFMPLRGNEQNPKVLLVKSLAETYFYCKKNYYNGHPTVTDECFDAIENGLKALCPAHPLLSAVGDVSFTDYWPTLADTAELIHNPPVEMTDDDLMDAL